MLKHDIFSRKAENNIHKLKQNVPEPSCNLLKLGNCFFSKLCAILTSISDNISPFIMSLCQPVKVSHDSDSFIFLVSGTLSLSLTDLLSSLGFTDC